MVRPCDIRPDQTRLVVALASGLVQFLFCFAANLKELNLFHSGTGGVRTQASD